MNDNNNNMSDMMKNLSGMLNGKEIPDDVKNMLNSVMNNPDAKKNIQNTLNDTDFSNIDMNTLLKIQGIMKNMNNGESNARANLLRSLKPYLKKGRQDKVEQYIQLFNMEKVLEMFNNNSGGDKK